MVVTTFACFSIQILFVNTFLLVHLVSVSMQKRSVVFEPVNDIQPFKS